MNNLYTLDQICKKITDGSHQSPKEDPTGYPMVSVKDMTEFGFDLSKVKHISKNDFEKLVKQGCKPEVDDILIAKDGSVMKHIFRVRNADNIVLLSSIAILRPNKEIVYPDFLVYSLKNNGVKEDILNNYVSGSGVPRIVLKDFKKVELDIPNLDLQINISKKLRSLDDKIELNTQINQTLEQIAQALFKSWFVDFDPVRAKVQALSDGLSLEQAELAAMQAISGKTPEELTALSQTQPDRYAELAETAKAFPYEIVEVDGVEVPKGWEVKRIDEVIQKIPVGKKYSSKTAFSEGLVPILDQGRSGVIGYHNNKPGVKASIEDPIIVFANHTCYMRLISYDFSAIQNVFAFKGKECNLYWLYLATLGKQEFVEYKGHFPDFLIKEIVVPPEELTALFGKYVKESFSKIFINDRENSNLAKIRDLLLPKLLNGEFIR